MRTCMVASYECLSIHTFDFGYLNLAFCLRRNFFNSKKFSCLVILPIILGLVGFET